MKKEKRRKVKKMEKSKGLIHCVCLSLLFEVVLCDFLCVQTHVSSMV
jgi:hypothetical protein